MKVNLAISAEKLAALKDEKKREVDATVERLRLRFITPGDGQMMVYLTKEAEARAYLADPFISPSQVAHIMAEAERLDVSPSAIASLVITMAEQWRVVSSRMEGMRQKVKTDIDNASTKQQVLDAANVDWEAVLAGAV